MNRAMSFQSGTGMKISASIPADVSEEYLQFLQQIGVNWVYTWVTEDQANAEFISSLIEKAARYDIRVDSVGYTGYGKSPDIMLGTEKRDEKIAEFQRFIRLLGSLDVHTTIVTWEPNRVISTSMDGKVLSAIYQGEYEPARTRGGAQTRIVDLTYVEKAPMSHGRIYTKEEIWECFRYFADAMMPVCEEAGVRIALHPNDPPVDSLLGIATLIQCHQDYEKAFSVAGSEFLGMELCCGCWLEGGRDRFGDLEQSIAQFVKEERVCTVHFRNITAPLPLFKETFLDDGYQNMYLIMKALVKAGYNGSITLDHTPKTVPSAGRPAETAFGVAYIKALKLAAETELANAQE